MCADILKSHAKIKYINKKVIFKNNTKITKTNFL